ncbi:MAG: hypothetical protein GEV12_13035 [Micromonosporaceae bacterium]|nr:hypothetical protein [Micromonosporaceae bacterium]
MPSWNDAAGGGPDQRSGDPSVSQEWEAAGPVGGSSRVQAALSRILAYGLWGGIGLALVLGLVNCAGPRNAASLPPAADPEPPPPVAPPGGCAELVVSAWLAGDTELLAGVPGVPRSGAEPGRRQATRTYTAGVTPGAAGDTWGYLVGADVQVLDGEAQQWRPAGSQFFAVTMVRSTSGGCQGWRPAALPAQVPAPQLAGDAADQQTPYEVSLPTSGTELSGTLQAFFAGMLAGGAGGGGLERYVAPGVVIPPLSPPPYQEVSISELRAPGEPAEPVPADGTLVQLLVTVATDQDDLPLVYPVTVGVRGGRWEVVALDPLVSSPVGAAPRSTNGD